MHWQLAKGFGQRSLRSFMRIAEHGARHKRAPNRVHRLFRRYGHCILCSLARICGRCALQRLKRTRRVVWRLAHGCKHRASRWLGRIAGHRARHGLAPNIGHRFFRRIARNQGPEVRRKLARILGQRDLYELMPHRWHRLFWRLASCCRHRVPGSILQLYLPQVLVNVSGHRVLSCPARVCKQRTMRGLRFLRQPQLLQFLFLRHQYSSRHLDQPALQQPP
mmetsp:Transcript_95487/g.270032  ORF Transcript_95487/g.270032 Transcript_95487/m.270032 type:complete len:221 (-) Transcript_95487:1643-2305(-)